MAPVPPEKRTRGKSAFVTYWFSDLVTILTWSFGSVMLTIGLTATDAVLIVLVAALCNAVPTVLTGAIGSNLYISFSHRIAREFRVLVQLFRGCQSGRLGDVLVRGTNSKWRYMCCCNHQFDMAQLPYNGESPS